MHPRNLVRWILLATTAVVAGAAGAAGCGLSVTGVVDASSFDGSPGESGAPPDDSGIGDAHDEAQAPIVCSAPHTCVSVPKSWSVVTIVDSRAAEADLTFTPTKDCAPGWANRQVGIENPHGIATTCSCVCGGPKSSPCPADAAHTLFLRTGGSGSCNDLSIATNTDGNCHVAGNWPGNTNGAGGTAVGAQAVACSSTTTLPGPTSDGAFAVCSLASSIGACTGGTCLDAPTTPICLARSGVQDCPAGSYNRHVIAPPEKIVDKRTCAACTCTSSASSCSTSLTAYANSNCSGMTQSVTFDGTCHGVTATPSAGYRYTVTPDTLACSTLTANVGVGGSIERTNETTLCCVP